MSEAAAHDPYAPKVQTDAERRDFHMALAQERGKVIAELRLALRGMIGLADLLLVNTDVSEPVKAALRESHRLEAAHAALKRSATA